MSEQIIPGSYWIVGGLSIVELMASLQLGDNQHRRDYFVNLRRFASGGASVTGDAFEGRLRIDGLKRSKSNCNTLFDFEGVAVLPTGLVRIKGNISVPAWQSVRGDLHTIPQKECPKCMVQYYTDRNRCDVCGEVLAILDIHSLI